MESFRSILEKQKIQLSLYYYGVEDLATGWEIKNIVDNKDIFLNKYSELSISHIWTIDDYYLYLLSIKLRDMRDITPYLLQEEHKKIVVQISNHAEKIISSISNGDIIKYINEHFEDIFDKDKSSHDMRAKTLDIITNFIKGIQTKVFEYLCRQYGYLMVDRFEQFENIFENNIDIFEILFPTGHFNEINSFGLEKVLNIWSYIIKREQSRLKILVEKKVEILFDDVKLLSDSATVDNIMILEGTIRKFQLFLQQINSSKANTFLVYYKKAKKLLSEYIKTRGQIFEHEIPIGDIISEWKTQKTWETKLLFLTHSIKKDEESIKCISHLSKVPEQKVSFLDFVSTNIPTDDFYTLSYQQHISVTQNIGTITIFSILQQKENLFEYLSLINTAITYICEQIEITDDQFEEDLEMLFDMIQLVFEQQNAKNSIVNGLCYGTSMFICAFLEKILRIFYFNLVKDEKYVPINKATLGELLTTSNKKMVEVFEEIHIKNLSFFLQQVNPSKIGHNIRNSLAHWSNISRKELTPMFVSKTLWLFTDIINTLLWYYLKNTLEEDDKYDKL